MATNDRASPARRSVNLSTYGLTEKPMKILATSLAAAGVLLTASAFASERYSEETALCASAIATETGRSLDDANITLKKMRDRAVKRLTVQVKFSDGASSTGECFIRKGEVESVNVEA